MNLCNPFTIEGNNWNNTKETWRQMVSNNSTVSKSIKNENNVLENKYKYFENRISTFNTWPKAMSIKKNDLCSAGFTYTGQSDKVQCCFCKVFLHTFEVNDNIFTEHI